MKHLLIKGTIYLGLLVVLVIVLWLIIIGAMPTMDDVRVVWDALW